jgi:hypothetical protein
MSHTCKSNVVRTVSSALGFLLIATIAVVSAEKAEAPVKIAIADLLSAKDKWKSKRVEIIGYHRTMAEMSAIYPTMEDAELPHRNAEKGLWVDYSGSPPGVKLVKAGYVRIVGTFKCYSERGCGHMNRWPAEIGNLEVLEPVKQPQTNSVKSSLPENDNRSKTKERSRGRE